MIKRSRQVHVCIYCHGTIRPGDMMRLTQEGQRFRASHPECFTKHREQLMKKEKDLCPCPHN